MQEKVIRSPPGCFGTTSNSSFWINITCGTEEVIAVQDAVVSFQPASTNCSIQNIFSKYKECCWENKNCSFSYAFQNSIFNTATLPELFNGNQTETRPFPQIPPSASCDTNIYQIHDDQSAHYMHINYVCIDSKSLF